MRDQRHVLGRSLCAIAAPILMAAALSASASAQGSSSTLAVLPIKLLDTSAEPRDQSAEHRARLERMAAGLSSDLGSIGPYRTVIVGSQDLQSRCAPETTDCILAAARSHGADLVFVGAVHKSSTLIMQMWARIVDARTGGALFSRELNFRGDNDEAWHRAEAFLVDQVKAAHRQPPP